MKLLDTVVDKNGNAITVHFVPTNEMSGEVTAFLLRGWAELIENGHCAPNYVPPTNNKRVLYCMFGSKVVALLMWDWINSTAFIIFTYIDPAHRKTGLFKILHHYYNERVIAGSATDSKCQVHITNTASLGAFKSQEYEVEYYRLVKKY